MKIFFQIFISKKESARKSPFWRSYTEGSFNQKYSSIKVLRRFLLVLLFLSSAYTSAK